MQSQPLTDRHTIADFWSDLYETWARSFVSPWKLVDTSIHQPGRGPNCPSWLTLRSTTEPIGLCF
jgi:hypothetical protein